MTKTIKNRRTLVPFAFVAAAAWLSLGAAPSEAQTLSGNALIDALQNGGYVIVMRHASAETEAPQPRQASPGNVMREPELDDMGKATIEAMGYAFRKFRIPVADVYTSPNWAAYETAHFFGFGESHKMEELGTKNPSADWLRMRVRQMPPEGENDVVVTQAENLEAAFGREAADVAPGEALIFQPIDGGAKIIARMPIKDWAKLAVLGHT
jgi:hypothetical protein